MGAVDAAGLARKARAMAREEFTARHIHLYLVIAAHQDEQLGIGFETAVVSNFRGTLKLQQESVVDFDVLEVSKAPGNPYPDRISVGRARNCDLVLRDPSVSKLHAHLRLRDDGHLDVIDLGSQNGTRVNGRTLLANEPEWVTPGDSLMFGTLVAKLVDADTLFDLLQRHDSK
jgi:pSer/pThr/pTyr-binding forkhead associated (FHA) protein